MKFFLVFTAAALAVFAQADKQMTCDQNRGGDKPRFCRIVEQTIPAAGRLNVDSGKNGGIRVRGWNRSETLVRTKIEAWAQTESEVSLIGGQVHADVNGGQVRARGPETRDKGGWATSYEIFVPAATDLTLAAHNGGIHIADVQGKVQFNTTNGGVHISKIVGEVTGATTNGGVHVEMTGVNGPVNVRTTNGGVHVSVPNSISARVKASTVNGGIHSDFPMPTIADRDNEQRRRQRRDVEFSIGGGTHLIELSTTNGGVHLKRI